MTMTSMVTLPEAIAEHVLKLARLDLITDREVKKLYPGHRSQDVTSEAVATEEPDDLISENEIGPITYLLTHYLISYHNLRVEKNRGGEGEDHLISKREIGKILCSQEQWLIWKKIYELKATCVPELEDKLGCDDQTAWRTVKPLIRRGILKITNEVPHPKGRGNEIVIISLADADPKASRDAAGRARVIVGNKQQIKGVYDEREEIAYAAIITKTQNSEITFRDALNTLTPFYPESQEKIKVLERLNNRLVKDGIKFRVLLLLELLS